VSRLPMGEWRGPSSANRNDDWSVWKLEEELLKGKDRSSNKQGLGKGNLRKMKGTQGERASAASLTGKDGQTPIIE